MNPFDGPRLKIQRAKRHLADVQSEIELFLNRRPYRPIVEADANPNFQRVVMRQVAAIIRLMGLDDARFWNERDCEFRASWDSDMNQDRARMHENWTGFSGIEQEDAIIAVSMGPIVDRTKEYLVAGDQAVVYLRRRLLESVRRVEAGGDPIGVSISDYTEVRALVDTVIDKRTRWQDVTPSRLGSRNDELETV